MNPTKQDMKNYLNSITETVFRVDKAVKVEFRNNKGWYTIKVSIDGKDFKIQSIDSIRQCDISDSNIYDALAN